MSQTKAQLIDNLVQPITGALGSASAPTFSFTSDPNTGIYSPGADQLAISTNGTGRLFVDASGNVGIGGSPTDALFVTGSVANFNVRSTSSSAATSFKWGNNLDTKSTEMWVNGSAVSTFGGASAFNVYQAAAAPILVSTNGSERLRITAAGLVGVGTSSPGSRCEIDSTGGAASATGATTASNASLAIASVNGLGTQTKLYAGVGTSDYVWLQSQNGNSTRNICLNPVGGSVGIGTSSPVSNLHVNTSGTGDYTSFFLSNSGASGRSYQIGVGGSGTLAGYANNLYVFDNIAAVTRIVLDPSGRVGIGTTSPVRLFHVSGSGTTARLTSSTSTSSLEFETTGGFAYVGAKDGPNIYVETNGSERLRVDSSGRLLVGTSSASNTFTTALLQGNTISSAGDGVLRLARGSTPGSSDGLGYIVFSDNGHGDAAYIFSARDGGTWNTSTSRPTRLVFSTTTDGASSPTERMRITQDGYIRAGSGGDGIFQGSVFARLTGNVNTGIGFTNFGAPGIGAYPSEANGNATDGLRTLGSSGARWSVVYATTGSINTSDENEKQDIRSLNAAELAVASELKTLIKAFRWKDAVNTKGDEARIHVGVIAQEVQELFAQHGLDVSKYALWCSDIIYELDGKPATPDENGNYPPDATTKIRLGVRYSELLAFVISAL